MNRWIITKAVVFIAFFLFIGILIRVFIIDDTLAEKTNQPENRESREDFHVYQFQQSLTIDDYSNPGNYIIIKFDDGYRIQLTYGGMISKCFNTQEEAESALMMMTEVFRKY